MALAVGLVMVTLGCEPLEEKDCVVMLAELVWEAMAANGIEQGESRDGFAPDPDPGPCN